MGSSPVVGSSKKTTWGSVTSARAMATRLRMPPEISAGYLWPISAEPDLRQRLLRPRQELGRGQPAALPERESDVLEHGQRVEERAALEHDPVALADLVEGPAAEGRHVLAVDDHAAGVGPDQAEQVPEQHRLAAAAAADDDHQLGRRDLEVDAAEDLLAPEALAEPLDPDGGRRRRRHGSTEPRK